MYASPGCKYGEITDNNKEDTKRCKYEVTLISHEYNIISIICDLLKKNMYYVSWTVVIKIPNPKAFRSQTCCIRGSVVFIISKVSSVCIEEHPKTKFTQC
jgi:hypothetical protein